MYSNRSVYRSIVITTCSSVAVIGIAIEMSRAVKSSSISVFVT